MRTTSCRVRGAFCCGTWAPSSGVRTNARPGVRCTTRVGGQRPTGLPTPDGDPGVGVLTAMALLAAVGDAAKSRNGRQMAASLGLVPRQRSTGGQPTLLGISKRGDASLRTLLIHRALVRALRRAAQGTDVAAGCLPRRTAETVTWRRSPSPTRTPGPPGRCWRGTWCSMPNTGGPRERGPAGTPGAWSKSRSSRPFGC